jgi:hypothetical protein
MYGKVRYGWYVVHVNTVRTTAPAGLHTLSIHTPHRQNDRKTKRQKDKQTKKQIVCARATTQKIEQKNTQKFGTGTRKPMTFLTASCANLVAVIHNASTGHDRLSIPLYQSSGALQSTLTCSVENEDQVAKLVFCSSTYLCALFHSLKVLVWNVERGVLVHTFKGEEYLDITTGCGDSNSDALYCLLSKKSKLYVHQYSLDTGKVVRKIKCGKGVEGTLAVSEEFIAVRQEDVVRIMSQSNGSKVGKCKLFETSGGRLMAMNGSTIAAVTSTGVSLLSCETQEQVGAIFIETPVHSVTMTKDLLFVNSTFACELYEYNSTALLPTSKEPLKPITTITLPDSDVHVHSHGKNVIAISRNEQGQVHIQKVDIRDQTKVVLDQSRTTQDEETPTTTKRSLPVSATTTLGPGQAGAEAMQVDDRAIKKAKTATNELDISIQERLQQLASDFQDDDDEEDEDEAPPKLFKATTESLSNLLQQSLQSGDDGMLELSLTCRDKQIIQRSLQQLEPSLVSTLLTKLTARLASKPNRAGDLALWIQLVLTCGKIRHVQQLRPLRNLLHERVESFPHLLKLEGRLSVLQASSLK